MNSPAPLHPLIAFIRLGRPHFLIGGFLLHALGAIIAVYGGAGFDLAAFVWGQVAITTTQLMTHYANDYFDLEADRANETPTNWSGGSRVLIDGSLPAHTAHLTALVLAIIAFAAVLILSIVIRPGVVTFALFFGAQLLAWFYSAPPIRLQARGLGELTTAIVVTLLAPLAGFYLQAGEITTLPLLAVVPLCCFQFAMLLAIEFPDAAGDRLSNKRTLVVRFGASFAARLYVALLLIAYTLLPLLVAAGLPATVALSVMLVSPLGLWQVWRFMRGAWRDPNRWNSLAFYSIVLLVATSAAELAAFALLLGLS